MTDCHKVRYGTEQEAVEAMHRIRLHRIHSVRRAYRCRLCGCWHLSKRGETPSAQCVMLQKLSGQ